jgi:hypothetical protein
METIKQSSKNSLLFIIMTILPVWVALGLYGYIGSFNRLMGDSLCSYYYAERLGLLRSIWFWRNIWSGRYSAYGFDWLATKLFPPQNIPFFIPLVLLLWVAINTWVIFLLLRKKSAKTNTFLTALLLGSVSVFLTLAASPFIQQSFFWVDGFRAYTLPVIVLTAYLIPYFLFFEKINSRSKAITAAFTSLFLFFASGGLSETFAVFQFALLVFWIAYYWLVERPAKIDNNLLLLIGGLIGSIIAIVVIVTAPGNAIRQSLSPPPLNLFGLLSISLKAYGTFLFTIISTPEKITTLIGSILAAFWAGSLFNTNSTAHGKRILLQITGAFLLSFTCFPPGVYGYSEPPPDRVLSIATFIITVLLMSAAFWTGNLYQEPLQKVDRSRSVLASLLILFLFSSAWMNASLQYNSRMEYISYAQEWDKTDAIIKAAQTEGKESITVPAVPNWAAMDLLNDNPKHWVNECYSNFYGIQVFGER